MERERVRVIEKERDIDREIQSKVMKREIERSGGKGEREWVRYGERGICRERLKVPLICGLFW